MIDNKAVMQQALDALERVGRVDSNCDIFSDELCGVVMDSIEGLRAAIAQPEQTPYDIDAAITRCGSHRIIPDDVKQKIRVELELAITQSKETK